MDSGLKREEYGHQLGEAIRRHVDVPCLFLVVRLFENHGGLPYILVLMVAVVADRVVSEDAFHETSNPLDEDLSYSLGHLRPVNAVLL